MTEFPTHCAECGRRLHNLVSCPVCGLVTCSAVCARRHARNTHSTVARRGWAGCLAVLVVFGILALVGWLFVPARDRATPPDGEKMERHELENAPRKGRAPAGRHR